MNRNLPTLLGICLAMVLPGCASGPHERPDPEDTRPALSDFQACDYTYPNGAPVRCEGVVAQHEAHRNAPPDYYCRGRAVSQSDYERFRWDPLTDTFLLEILNEKPRPEEQGAIVLSSGERVEVFAWKQVRGLSWIDLGVWPDGFDHAASLSITSNFTFTHENGTAPAVHRVHWSAYQSSWWLVHEVDVAGVPHWFMHVVPHFLTGQPASQTSFGLQGRDFNLTITQRIWGGTLFDTSEPMEPLCGGP